MFGYLMPNYILEEEYKSIGKKYIEKLERNNKKIASNNSKKVSIGIYVDNDEWYTNIYNTISTVVFIQNAVLNYNLLNDRFLEFIKIHKIDSNPSIFTYASIERTIKEFLKKLSKEHSQALMYADKEVKKEIEDEEKNIDRDLDGLTDIKETSGNQTAKKFTNNFSYNFLLATELDIPIAIGNTTDYFENCNNDYLKRTIVVNAEDNPDMNKDIIENILRNKEKIKENLRLWKKEYDIIAKENIEKMVKE